MDIGLGVALSILVAIVAILQGINMKRRPANGSISDTRPDGILTKLDGITGEIRHNSELLGTLNSRIGDCWEKLNKE